MQMLCSASQVISFLSRIVLEKHAKRLPWNFNVAKWGVAHG